MAQAPLVEGERRGWRNSVESIVVKTDDLEIDYDAKNDVLYISMGKHKEICDSVEPNEAVLLRSRNGEVVEIAITGLKAHLNQ